MCFTFNLTLECFTHNVNSIEKRAAFWVCLFDGTVDLNVLTGALVCVHSERAWGGALGADMSRVMETQGANICSQWVMTLRPRVAYCFHKTLQTWQHENHS